MNSPSVNGSFEIVPENCELDISAAERGKGHTIEEEKGVDGGGEAQTKSDELEQNAAALQQADVVALERPFDAHKAFQQTLLKLEEYQNEQRQNQTELWVQIDELKELVGTVAVEKKATQKCSVSASTAPARNGITAGGGWPTPANYLAGGVGGPGRTAQFTSTPCPQWNLSTGTNFGNGTNSVNGANFGNGTSLSNGTNFGNGTSLGNGTNFGNGTSLSNGTSLGNGTNFGNGTNSVNSTNFGNPTSLGNGMPTAPAQNAITADGGWAATPANYLVGGLGRTAQFPSTPCPPWNLFPWNLGIGMKFFNGTNSVNGTNLSNGTNLGIGTSTAAATDLRFPFCPPAHSIVPAVQTTAHRTVIINQAPPANAVAWGDEHRKLLTELEALRTNAVAWGEEHRRLLAEIEALRAEMAQVKQREAQTLLRMVKLGVAFNSEFLDGGSVFAESPIPNKQHGGIFYYELKIVKALEGNFLYFGLAPSHMPLEDCVGYDMGFAYERCGFFWGHEVEGCSYSGEVRPFIGGKPQFGAGDVVGCGINLATRQIIYTKNGERLDTTNLVVDSATELFDLFPCVTMFSPGDKIEANFGPNFKFDIINGI